MYMYAEGLATLPSVRRLAVQPIWHPSRGLLGPPWAVLGHLGAILGSLGNILGFSRGYLGPIYDMLELSWGCLRAMNIVLLDNRIECKC